MAPPTRLNPFHTPSRIPLASKDTTTRQTLFFNALARKAPGEPMRSISESCGITKGTGRY